MIESSFSSRSRDTILSLWPRLLALVERHVVGFGGARVDLTRPADLGRRLGHLLPMGDPSGEASERKHDSEHVGGNAERSVDDAAVEVDVGIELSLDEI